MKAAVSLNVNKIHPVEKANTLKEKRIRDVKDTRVWSWLLLLHADFICVTCESANFDLVSQ